MNDLVQIILYTTIFGLLVTGFYQFAMAYVERKAKSENQNILQDKIKKLLSSLKNTSKAFNAIEEEINEKQKFVAKLQKDENTYNNLLSLKREEVDAITNAIQSGAKKENDKSFWKGVLVNFVFFILGAVVSIVITKFVK